MKTNSIERQMQKHKEKMEQMAAEYKRLQKLQKAEEAKEEEKRAVKLGILMQKLIPDVTKLDDSNFKKFLEKTVANDFGKRALSSLLSEQERANSASVESVPVKEHNIQPIKPVASLQKQTHNAGNNIDIE